MYKQDLELSQFFTPKEVSDFMATLLDSKEGDIVIDPACGEGVLLNSVLSINDKVKTVGVEIDKNLFARATMNNLDSNVFLHNGLYSNSLDEDEEDISEEVQYGSFDAVIGNPPFYGTKNKVVDRAILNKFKVAELLDSKKGEIIEVLFLERFVQLLKPNGKLCAILPEGILSDKRLSKFREWLFEELQVEAIIRLPEKGVFNDAKVNAVILCARKKPVHKEKNRTFFVREVKLEELSMLLDFMKRSKIFM